MGTPEFLTIFEQGMGRRRSQRTGYLYKKGGYWYLQYRVDSRETDAEGKMLRKNVTVQLAPLKGPGKLDLREARREAWNRYLSDVDVMSLRPGSSLTLQEFVEHRPINPGSTAKWKLKPTVKQLGLPWVSWH